MNLLTCEADLWHCLEINLNNVYLAQPAYVLVCHVPGTIIVEYSATVLPLSSNYSCSVCVQQIYDLREMNAINISPISFELGAE